MSGVGGLSATFVRAAAMLVLLAQLSATTGLELEGSGISSIHDSYPSTLLDQEADGDQDDLLEGSGGGAGFGGYNDQWTTFDATKTDQSANDDDYYYNYDYLDAYVDSDQKKGDTSYDYLEEYLDNESDAIGSNRGGAGAADTVFDDNTSVGHDIAISAGPTEAEEEEIVINMSQIFIMVGSSFISFAIFIFTFFLCRKFIANRQKKGMAYHHGTPEKLPASAVKEPPIVKDYQKVPTTTQEILKCNNSTRLDMYGAGGGGRDPENPSTLPLVP